MDSFRLTKAGGDCQRPLKNWLKLVRTSLYDFRDKNFVQNAYLCVNGIDKILFK